MIIQQVKGIDEEEPPLSPSRNAIFQAREMEVATAEHLQPHSFFRITQLTPCHCPSFVK
ncbi:hypothetical protein AN958_09739 [Leucoagaricus sp. SymC.cos]|nr:hypothetical protein AN958_09739 [Leucoagaricus sp. SymC.cos]